MSNKPEPPGRIEIDLRQLRRNWRAILKEKDPSVEIAAVLKDDAYGHGAVPLARVAVEEGIKTLAVATVQEGIELRAAGIGTSVLLLGERSSEDFPACFHFELTPTIGAVESLRALLSATRSQRRIVPIHLKIDTGMSRYGFRWSELDLLLEELRSAPEIRVEGIMSHFAMSDELDKSFARLQLSRFHTAICRARAVGVNPAWVHICNSGGFLDIPEAHFNLVRVGILALGVFPSRVCRRIEGVEPIMSVRSRLAAVKQLEAGDHVGYGMRFTAPGPMRIGMVPVGYGAGYPRVRNQGHVLIDDQRAPIIGGVSMDAIIVDLTQTPAQTGDRVTLLGRDRCERITFEELAALRATVSYDIMTSWNSRLPRYYTE